MNIFWGGLAAVAVMYAAFLVVGWLASRKVRRGGAAELILAGRNMPLWIATLTMTATWVDGGYLLGTVEYTQRSLAKGVQGGVCFGISLILGGLFFAKRMRRMEYTTLIDPFESRFGRHWAAVLLVPALFSEVFWSASLLVAIAATFGVILDIDLATGILISAAVVTTYTVVGGMWSVAYTDAFQLALIPIGLLAALPFALEQVGGLAECLQAYFERMGTLALPVPPLLAADRNWTVPQRVAWWDLTAMLILGGIPWNCYFQRVLSCQTPTKSRWHSIIAGCLTIALTAPPLLLGMAALVYQGWTQQQRQIVENDPSMTLPLMLRYMVPYAAGVLGLGAIVGAVTSSFSASILSAGSMFAWNVYRRLLVPQVTAGRLRDVIRAAILVLGAALMAFSGRSVAALWFFTADLVYVLLFPQLVMAMFDPRANRIGSVAALAVSLVLRAGGGIPLLLAPAFIPYAELFQAILPGEPGDWYDPDSGETLFPVKSLAAAVGLVLLPVVSRLTARWDRPRILAKVE